MHFLPTPLALFDFSGTEVLLVMFVVLLLFGGEKLPELARGLGKSIREFKKATAGVEEEIKRAIEMPPEPARPKPPATPKLDEPPPPPPSANQGNPFLAQPPPPDKPAGS